MKLFLVSLFFIPFMVFAGLDDQDEFLIDQRVATDGNSPSGASLTSGSPSSSSNTSSVSGSSGNYNDDVGQPIDATGGFNQTQQGGLDGVGRSSGLGNAVAVLGAAMGAAYIRTCFSCSPSPCWSYCGLGAMALGDAASGLQSARSANLTGTHLDTSYGQLGTSSIDPALQAQIDNGMQTLSDNGVVLNANGTVTTPDGETYAASDFATAEDMIAKGIPPKQANAMAANMNNVKNEAAKKTGIDLEKLEKGEEQEVASAGAAASASGYGGGVAGGGGLGSASIIEELEIRGKKKKKGVGRMPASQAADLSKDFNGDPIGIGMANIFLIIHKKYKKKNKANAFFKREY